MTRPVKLISVKREPHNGKEFVARFRMSNGREKLTRFGTSSNFLLNKAKTEQDRQAYIARHRVRENFANPTSAGALSRYILWHTRSLRQNVADYRKRFNL